MFRILFFITVVLMLVSFQSKQVSKLFDNYREWYASNGSKLIVDRTKNKIDYRLNYIPAEVSILGDLNDKEKVSKKELNLLKEKYGLYEEYTLKISTPNARNFLLSQSIDKNDLTSKQYYLMGEVINDFVLVNGSDSLIPLRCDFEDNFGAAPFINLHLVFSKQKSDKAITTKKLIYYDALFAEDSIVYNLDQLTQLKVPKI